MPTLSQHACFVCRKVFKKPHFYASLHRKDRDKTPPVYSCPGCGAPMISMGYKFRAPKKQDTRAWKNIENSLKMGMSWEIPTIRKKAPDAKISHALKAALGITKHE